MKYKVNDYIIREGVIFHKIEAILDQEITLYATSTFRSKELIWWTEYELDDAGYRKEQPQFEQFKKIETGDIVMVPEDKDWRPVKVLARVDNLVMLSLTTPTRTKRERIQKMAEQLEQLTQGRIEATDIVAGMPQSSVLAHKKTSSGWVSIEELALNNWKLLHE